MKIKVLKSDGKSFHISVGEEGAVAILCDGSQVLNKLFTHTTEEKDVAKLTQLLKTYTSAPVYIYIDTLDQSYVQKSIPSPGQIGLRKIAQNRLNRDTPKNHLKSCIQIGRMLTGRKDFVFTFISAPNEPPLSSWLEYLIPFDNIINGIYFLPVELEYVIRRISGLNASEDRTEKKKPDGWFQNLLKKFSSKQGAKIRTKWDLLITHNKTGGFRQVAYQDGKIIFSRLLNNIDNELSDVLAGNIEQEISNSVEYLTRLSLNDDPKIEMYLILSEDVLKNIRFDKLKSSKVYSFTPFSLARALKIKGAASERDKFSDPTILSILSLSTSKAVTMHTGITGRVLKFVKLINAIKLALKIMTPVILGASMLTLIDVANIRENIYSTAIQARNILGQISTSGKLLDEYKLQIGSDISLDQVLEIYGLYKFLTLAEFSPIDEFFFRMTDNLNDEVRVKKLKYRLVDPTADNYRNLKGEKYQMPEIVMQQPYTLTMLYNLRFSKQHPTIDELQTDYKDFKSGVQKGFSGYSLDISDLPDTFSFKNTNEQIHLVVNASKTVAEDVTASSSNISQRPGMPEELSNQSSGEIPMRPGR